LNKNILNLINYKMNKNQYKSCWKYRGIKFSPEEFEFIWGVYENIENCMLCSKHFKNSFDKCLDHNHENGEIRYILCRGCNSGFHRKLQHNNKSGYRYIYIRKTKGYEYYKIDITKNKKILVEKCFNTKKYSIEQVVKIRNNLLNTLD